MTRWSALTSAGEPWVSTLPSAMTITGWQSRVMKSMSCSIMQKV